MNFSQTSALTFRSRISAYKELSKSGIVTLVLISVLGGYLTGQPFETPLDVSRLLITLFGILFLASGSSALNQIQESKIDAEMPRTAGRPLPSGRMSAREAWLFTIVCLVCGLVLLHRLGPALLIYGVLAVFSYNVLYTLWWKKNWAFAAVPGAFPGALPILMGYASASGKALAPGGVYLFLLLFFWQMPHFWALALRYRKDYEAGGFPTLPVAHGAGITVTHIVLWCLAYVGIALIGPLFLKVRAIYCIVTFLMSAMVLFELRGFVREPESKRWLRFFLWVNFSLIAYIGAAVVDLWSVYAIPYLTR